MAIRRFQSAGVSLVTAALLITGAVLDMTWMVESWLPDGLSSAAYLSQWEMPGVRYAQWWRECFTTSDVAVLIAALIALGIRRHPPGDGSETVAWTALAVFGFASATSDVVPMRVDVNMGVDLGRFVVSTGLLVDVLGPRLTGHVVTLGMHSVASVLSGAALSIAIYALTRSSRARYASTGWTEPHGTSSPRQRYATATPSVPVTGAWSPLPRYGFYAWLAQLCSGLALVAAIVLHTAAGVAGRLELTTEAGILVLLATDLIRRPLHSGPPSFDDEAAGSSC